jgi:hypothetical protein
MNLPQPLFDVFWNYFTQAADGMRNQPESGPND